MKVEIEIPEGKYCVSMLGVYSPYKCLFHGMGVTEYYHCYYLQEDLEDYGLDWLVNVKHPKCPSLKEHTQMWQKKEEELDMHPDAVYARKWMKENETRRKNE